MSESAIMVLVHRGLRALAVVLAFTDWVEGPAGLTDSEAQRFLGMMTFAKVEDIVGYVKLLSASGCEVRVAEDTGRFASHFDLYLKMIEMQLSGRACVERAAIAREISENAPRSN